MPWSFHSLHCVSHEVFESVWDFRLVPWHAVGPFAHLRNSFTGTLLWYLNPRAFVLCCPLNGAFLLMTQQNKNFSCHLFHLNSYKEPEIHFQLFSLLGFVKSLVCVGCEKNIMKTYNISYNHTIINLNNQCNILTMRTYIAFYLMNKLNLSLVIFVQNVWIRNSNAGIRLIREDMILNRIYKYEILKLIHIWKREKNNWYILYQL